MCRDRPASHGRIARAGLAFVLTRQADRNGHLIRPAVQRVRILDSDGRVSDPRQADCADTMTSMATDAA